MTSYQNAIYQLRQVVQHLLGALEGSRVVPTAIQNGYKAIADTEEVVSRIIRSNTDPASTLTDAELADPVFMRAYIAGYDDSFAITMDELKKTRIELATTKRALTALVTTPPPKPFQFRVLDWMTDCFGPEISGDKEERNHRFYEEATELVQACGMTQEAAHQLVDYTYGRPVGEKDQEVGGTMTTLAALCLAQGIDLAAAADKELSRNWVNIHKIREKQKTKPKFGPLPTQFCYGNQPMTEYDPGPPLDWSDAEGNHDGHTIVGIVKKPHGICAPPLDKAD